MIDKSFILSKLQEFKPQFERDGVLLLGLFGSYSQDRANEESDIDILIETTPAFLKTYRGFKAFSKLDELKLILQKTFNKEIDFTDRQGLLQHKNAYILDKTIYV